MATTTETAATAPVAANADSTALSGIAPATTFSTSGAPVQIVPDVDPDHPAVASNPRENRTLEMNKIDFNDPMLSGAEAAAQMLEKQKPTKSDTKA